MWNYKPFHISILLLGTNLKEYECTVTNIGGNEREITAWLNLKVLSGIKVGHAGAGQEHKSLFVSK